MYDDDGPECIVSESLGQTNEVISHLDVEESIEVCPSNAVAIVAMLILSLCTQWNGEQDFAMASLLGSLHSAGVDERSQGLERVATALQGRTLDLTSSNVTAILVALLYVYDQDDFAREATLCLARDLLIMCHEITKDLVDVVLRKLLKATSEDDACIRQPAEECVEALFGGLGPEETLKIIVPMLATPGTHPYSLAFLIRLLTRNAVSRLHPAKLIQFVPTILPPLFQVRSRTCLLVAL